MGGPLAAVTGATVVHDADGRAVRMVGVTHDTTEATRRKPGCGARAKSWKGACGGSRGTGGGAGARGAGRAAGGAGPACRRHRARLQQRAAGDGRRRLADRAPTRVEAGRPPPRPAHLGGGRPRRLDHPAPACLRPPRRPARREAGRGGAAGRTCTVILAHTLGAGIDVQVRPGADRLVLMADKGQLETALVNLATNARDAMPDGGRLTLSTADRRRCRRRRAAPGRPCRPGATCASRSPIPGWAWMRGRSQRASEPFFTTKADGRRHRAWPVDGQGLRRAVRRRAGHRQQPGPGHHRHAVAARGRRPLRRAARPARTWTTPARTSQHRAGEPAARAVVLVVDDEELDPRNDGGATGATRASAC